MKRHLILVLLLIVSQLVFSQTQEDTYTIILEKFEKEYNESNYEKVFSMFSDEMKEALPMDKTMNFLLDLKSQAGNITNREFIKYENLTYASYKTNFTNAILTLNISINNNSEINGLFIKPYVEHNLSKPKRNSTKLKLPFKEEWTVNWGGDTKEQNYHIDSEAQKNAFDFVIKNEEGNSYKTNGKTNEDYYAFGKQIIAPCVGEVILVVDGINDNIPGESNLMYIPRNTIIIRTQNNEYLFFAHFKQNSIMVKQGQKVSLGDLLGLCGNSGNSSEPHLHFHVQNTENTNIATGMKCYFESIIVNGEVKSDYSPVQNEIITNQ